MKVSDAFPSRWLKATDLQGREASVTMDRVILEDIGDDVDKPVLYFQGKKKGLVLNKTNGNTIACAYGDETDGWQGRPVVIYPAETAFQGRMVPCLRVRIPPQVEAPPPEQPAAGASPGPNPYPPISPDEIPF